MRIENNYNLLRHNTFGIEVHCRKFVEYTSADELRTILGQRPLLHIGGGSNLLFLGDYKGTVLHSAIQTLEHSTQGDDVLLRVGSGMVWDDLVAQSIAHGWYGLENLSLIPGEVGASAVQNIGAYGSEAKDYITQVECMNLETGQLHTFSNEECHYGYRRSIFKTPEERGRWAVLYVHYRLSLTFTPRLDYGGIRLQLQQRGIPAETVTASQLRQTIIDIRQGKLPDPKVQGNAGSFFMNPVVPREKYEALARLYPDMPHYDAPDGGVKIPAGWMIEQCGWKGRRLGPAAVHNRQALVLVNLGGATGHDILQLCHAVRDDVARQFGIDIHPEVNII